MAGMKLLKRGKGISRVHAERRNAAGGDQAFDGVMGKVVLVVIQKTTNVEPVTPIQHLQFCLLKISYGK
jgi:hypothetical protein